METQPNLVRRAQRGEREAFDGLVRSHYAMVWRIVLGFTAIPEEARDLAQEVFLAAYEHLGALVDAERFPDWLATIARNKAVSWHRRRHRQPPLLSLDDGATKAAAAKISLDLAREHETRESIRQDIARAVAALAAGQQQVLRLHYLKGYGYTETATLLDVPESTVRGRLHRAREALRKELCKMAEEPTKLWALGNADLQAIRTAASFAWPTSEREVINSICFSEGGRLVASDTYRLYCYTSAALEAIPPTVVHADLGRTLRDQHQMARGGELRFAGGEAFLRLDDGAELSAPIITAEYPNWQGVVADSWALRAVARVGDWLESLDLLSRQQDAACMPASDTRSRIVVVLSPQDGSIALRQGMEPPGERRTGWECTASLPASFQQGEEQLVLAAKADYVEEAIRALQLADDAEVELAANGPLKSFKLGPVGSDRAFVVTMPMQLPGAVSDSDDEAVS